MALRLWLRPVATGKLLVHTYWGTGRFSGWETWVHLFCPSPGCPRLWPALLPHLGWPLSYLTDYATSHCTSELQLHGAPLTNVDVVQCSDPVNNGLVSPHCLLGRRGLTAEEGRTDSTPSPWLYSGWGLGGTRKPQGDCGLGVCQAEMLRTCLPTLLPSL